MELSDVRLALRRYWPIGLLALAFWLAIGGIIGVLPSDRYRTGTTILTMPTAAASGNPVQVVNLQVPAIVARIQSGSFISGVRESLPPRVAGESVTVSAKQQPGSGIIRITVEGGDPEALAAWATAVGEAIVAAQSEPLLELEMLDPAAAPVEPYAPEPVGTLLAATAAGLLSAVLATVTVHRMRRALDIDEGLRRRLGIPVLGYLPVSRGLRRSGGVLDAVRFGDDPGFVDAIQTVRTNAEFVLYNEGGARSFTGPIAISSWSTGEGKSTVAAALALTWASAGHDVVMVDADLRRPTQHTCLGEPFGEGLADVARVDPVRLVRPTREPKLGFIPAGIPDRHPSDVVAVNLPRVMSALAEDRRLVIIDTPPIHGVAETRLILSVAHRSILVVDASGGKMPEIEQAVQQLQQSGVVVMGVVVNRARRRGTSHGYGAYPATAPKARAAGRRARKALEQPPAGEVTSRS